MINDTWQHWQALDRWLGGLADFWAVSPFISPTPAWSRHEPSLDAWLLALSDEECVHFEQSPDALADALPAGQDWARQRRELVALPSLAMDNRALPEKYAPGMPGRKREQAGWFAGAVQPMAGSVMDWCCGTGHLARTLAAASPVSVTGLEWQRRLVQRGNAMAQERGEPVSLWAQDVLDTTFPWPPVEQAVALHACGDLHRTLLSGAVERTLDRLCLSPCCYHLTQADSPSWLSRRARDHGQSPRPDRHQRRLAVQEAVTASAGERRRNDRARLWRLGFDSLQRHVRGRDEYLPLPSMPRSVQKGDFAGFCAWAAGRKGLSLADDVDYAAWLASGERRHHATRRRELLWHLFRRPIELWLVLDYALFLEEQGYRVRLGTFCDRTLTPRNLLLNAVRDRRTPHGPRSHHENTPG
ncbi:SAM-dependent methyltransferase [Tamilnaduibacter salinus]|uniref:SAM-dependent methyltransferase n=1 Tax=Tamilnaduibacter salinus TaxID=1484056 RepID=A0A2A2I4B1_9GAMM|nr:methyltransferase [Tamilnaduibacter salinus]PAV25965.1 SAM-dependent methyltransferase [Tamilnaduibacter salinus]